MLKILKQVYFFMAIVLGVISLQSCSTHKPLSAEEKNQALLQALQDDGALVMRLGDNVVITLPSKNLFEGYSVKISKQGQKTLNDVAELLAPMNKVKIIIAAYAESMAQSKKDLILTQWQAEAVSNYLWEQHVDTRLLYAVGYGGGYPVQYPPSAALNDIVAKQENYRVEITLKDYVR